MRLRFICSILLMLATSAMGGAADEGTARLVNIATRVAVGGLAGTPIPGFVVAGTGEKAVIVRAVGPTLGGIGVGGVLADPRLSLVGGKRPLARREGATRGQRLAATRALRGSS